MSLDRIKGNVTFICDGSGCHQYEEGSDFGEVWNDAKAIGWTAKNEGGEWSHYCRSCSLPGKPDMSKLTKGL